METADRKKPKFKRKDWHKKIKLGSKQKKKAKWKGAKGRHNKIRLGRKGHATRPKVGWGTKSDEKGLVQGLKPKRIENTEDLKNIKKGQAVIIARVGKRKRELILAEAKKEKIAILNHYQEKK